MMNTALLFNRIQACAILLGLVASTMARAEEPPRKEKEYSVRIFCAGTPPVPKYVPAKGGGTRLVTPPFEASPPQVLVLPADKKGVERPVSLVLNALGPWEKFKSSEAPGGVLDFSALRFDHPDSNQWGATSQTTGISLNRMVMTRVPFGRINLPENAPQLLCLYQPKIGGLWSPPKQLLVDVSTEKLPTGACLLVNLSGSSVMAAVGVGAKPVTLPPDGGLAVINPFARLSNRTVPVKVAIQGAKKFLVLENRNMSIAEQSRMVFIITTAPAESNAGCPGRLFSFDLN